MKCTFRSVMIGDSAVGKTSIVNRFLRNSFDQSEPSTVGALYESHNETRNGKPIELQIWDTAGQEQYRSLGPIYFRSSAGAILVFDITNQKSFDSLDEWLNFYRNAGCENTIVMIVGNKNDLAEQRVITTEQGQAWAQAHGCTYIETSALQGYGIKNLFKTFIDQLLAQFEEEHEKRQSKMPKSATGLPPPAKEQKSGCC
ncbi:small GTP-binding protein, putative [Trichomonas vaginalis G3]|uniref:Small GTP-binding protein, putative n=1 Tax=Trichomonas vaginalis (strain ATCC PRA-98 / G3) TaxID=412133 RepID=A2DJF6_TRIV3|nr:GTPase protein [Trichomonas vaginalis G3]EAY19543.1 small GTP-binding protein, putative [Trichomonas vaginalis G3]KAI5519975.1 GTPase protein [Trichomonas vaginalis G3]|eukprot:XP_001580529.1 small GTP-binding protein [Trichomonas vaginalis G3]